jgi:hypothetical protein
MTGTDLNPEPLECGYKRGKTPLIRNLGTRCRRGQGHSPAAWPWLNRMLVGPKTGLEISKKRHLLLLPGFEPRTVPPVAHTLYQVCYPGYTRPNNNHTMNLEIRSILRLSILTTNINVLRVWQSIKGMQIKATSMSLTAFYSLQHEFKLGQAINLISRYFSAYFECAVCCMNWEVTSGEMRELQGWTL